MELSLLAALAALAVAIVAFVKVGSLEQRLNEALANRGSESTASDAPPADGDGQKLRALAATVQVLEMRAREQDGLLCSLVTEDEARHLWNISRGEPMSYDSHPGVQGELRSLVRRRLLAKSGDFKIHELPSPFDLLKYFQLTEHGEVLLTLRKHLEDDDLRAAQSIPPRPPAAPSASTKAERESYTSEGAA